MVLAPNATEDERDLAERWGRNVLHGSRYEGQTPRVTDMLCPRSERTRRFDLFQSGQSSFLEFAQTPLTPDDVRALADRYGPMRTQLRERWQCLDDYLGHRIDYWYLEIATLRKAVGLWDKAKATGDFSNLIRDLQRTTEFRFRRDREVGTGVNVLLKEDPADGSARLCMRPTHLCDALWIQLAHAIDGSEALRACVECKKWFTIKAGRGRSDKEYCSDACRMRAYRERKGKH